MRAPRKQPYRASRAQTTGNNIERQIAATDGVIDKMVYDLYGLPEEEINIVEG